MSINGEYNYFENVGPYYAHNIKTMTAVNRMASPYASPLRNPEVIAPDRHRQKITLFIFENRKGLLKFTEENLEDSMTRSVVLIQRQPNEKIKPQKDQIVVDCNTKEEIEFLEAKFDEVCIALSVTVHFEPEAFENILKIIRVGGNLHMPHTLPGVSPLELGNELSRQFEKVNVVETGNKTFYTALGYKG